MDNAQVNYKLQAILDEMAATPDNQRGRLNRLADEFVEILPRGTADERAQVHLTREGRRQAGTC